MANVTHAIPERIFYQLWTKADLFDHLDDYMDYYMSITSNTRIMLHKYNIYEDFTYDLLKTIYEYEHKPFKEIIDEIGEQPCKIYEHMCYPKRSYIDWYAGRREAASHIRLALMREYGLFKLPHGITLINRQTKMKEVLPTKEIEQEPVKPLDILSRTDYLKNILK